MNAMGRSSKLRWTAQSITVQACLSRPFARAPWSFTCCILSLELSLVTGCSKISSAARGYRLWRLLAQGFFSTRGRAAKGSPFVQKVRLAALSLQCSSAPPSVLARRSCARFADAGVPGLLLLLCFASGLELPQMRALSIAVAIALRRHVRSCSPRAAPHSPCFAGFVQVSMSAIQRGAVGRMACRFCLENSA